MTRLKIILISFSLLFVSIAYSGNIVYTIDISTLTNDEVVAVLALQGLSNRETPQILVEPRSKGGFAGGGYKLQPQNLQRDGLVAIAPEVLSKYESIESVWMEYYTNTKGYSFQRATFSELFSNFSTKYKGIVIYDGNNTRIGISPAVTIAGVKDAIPVTSALLLKYPALKIDTVENLVTRNFSTRLEAQAWLVNNYLTQTNKDFAYSYWEAANTFYTIDFAVSKKLFSFDLSFTSEKLHTAGTVIFSYDNNEVALLDQIFAYLNPGSNIIGWGASDELILQARCGDGGHALICTSVTPNLSFHSVVPVTETSFKQKRQLTANDVTLENKIYITFSINEGDTYKAVGNLMNDGAWLHQKRGIVPFNWPTNPRLLQLVPAIAKYYYESASNVDYFMTPSSGIGYFDATYSTPEMRTVYAQKAKVAAEFADQHYIDVWWNNFAGNDQWKKDMGMLGTTLWTGFQRVDFSKAIPVLESEMYYDLYWPPTKRKPSGMAHYIREQTKNVSGRPWFVHVYAADPAFAAEVMANLDPARFKAICMDEVFLLANKAKTKLLGRFIPKNQALIDSIITSTENERFTDEFNSVTKWNNVFCNHTIENGELTIEPTASSFYSILSKSNLKFDLTKYPIIAVKVNQFPANNVNWLIKMYDGITNIELPGTDQFKVDGTQNVFYWDVTKISNWSGIKTTDIQLALVGASSELLQNNSMKYDWVRSYESFDKLSADLAQSSTKELTADNFSIHKTNNIIHVQGSHNINSLKLYSLTGVLQRTSNNNQISCSGLPQGVYLLTINNVSTKKINL